MYEISKKETPISWKIEVACKPLQLFASSSLSFVIEEIFYFFIFEKHLPNWNPKKHIYVNVYIHLRKATHNREREKRKERHKNNNKKKLFEHTKNWYYALSLYCQIRLNSHDGEMNDTIMMGCIKETFSNL